MQTQQEENKVVNDMQDEYKASSDSGVSLHQLKQAENSQGQSTSYQNDNKTSGRINDSPYLSGSIGVVVSASKSQESRTKVIKPSSHSIRSNPNQIPKDILENSELNGIIEATLPNNYNFEIHKIIWRCRQNQCRRIGLQFPEGLFVFSIPISRILESFAGVQVVIFGDVTYGACCIDDFTAKALGCDLLVHFAHSCLVPVTQMMDGIKVLYIFVDIKFDVWHLVQTLKQNLTRGSRIAMAATIQFVTTIHAVKRELEKEDFFTVSIPQSRPLSKGEVLGCTASKLDETNIDHVVFVADGRFHLEAVMIANPKIKSFLRYNPYNKELTSESYDFMRMIKERSKAVRVTKDLLSSKASSITLGFLLGSLGRQGNRNVFDSLKEKILKHSPDVSIINFVVPEISPVWLNAFGHSIDVWIQVACPRLSIDWGEGFIEKPLLTPFELNVVLDAVPSKVNFLISEEKVYPMDFYANDSLGNWTPSHKCGEQCSCIQ